METIFLVRHSSIGIAIHPHILIYRFSSLECIVDCYNHIRMLQYEQEPNYKLLKSYVRGDLDALSPSKLTVITEWTDKPLKQIPLVNMRASCQQLSKVPVPITHKSVREIQEHNESRSMEAEYKDFMSIEIDEGIEISLQGLETRPNYLSSLSPNSQKDSNGSLSPDGRKRTSAEQGLAIQLMPFDFAGDEDFDVLAMHIKGANQELIKT
jgi:hypothetical protein